jgi:uncharacterized cysteine cluster protein YcgN (CxxCxxCC family)
LDIFTVQINKNLVTMAANEFWKNKKLAELTPEEWESLCDGCAICCLYKLQDEETDEIYYTDVACKLLDLASCTCTAYSERSQLMPTCMVLTPAIVEAINWLPATCAYRRLKEGQDLDWWHPLVSGKPGLVHRLGISIRAKAIPEKDVDMDNLEDRVVDWFT